MPSWNKSADDFHYHVEIKDGLISWGRHQGTPESAGAGEMLISQFLRTRRLKGHLKQVWGEEVLLQIIEAAIAEAPNQRPRQMRSGSRKA